MRELRTDEISSVSGGGEDWLKNLGRLIGAVFSAMTPDSICPSKLHQDVAEAQKRDSTGML